MFLTKKSPHLSLCLCASVVIFLACSQNEVKVEGPKPKAPENPRVAREVKKDGAGMGASPSMPVQEPTAAETPAKAAVETAAQVTTPTEATFTGTVVLPKALEARFKPGASLFVIARSAKQPKPVAAQRLTPEKFPVTFTLTAADSMLGDPLPQSLEIIVRLDADGDIATRGPEDLVASPVPASAGRAVTVTLEESGEQ